ncbi:MAG: hypothetical protein ABEJ67_05355 [Halanaeroarchaeum sp.]
MPHHEHVYEVYVDAADVDVALSSPLSASEVQFYDSGVWIERDRDRLFVPYRRIDLIREHRGSTTEEYRDIGEELSGAETNAEGEADAETETKAETAKAASAEREPDASESPSDPVED